MSGSRWQFTVVQEKSNHICRNTWKSGGITGVSEKSVRNWRGQKQKLSACSNTKKTFFHRRTAVFPDLEKEVAEFVRQLHARSLPVTSDCICIKAVEVACASVLSMEQFKGTASWTQRFTKRKGFCSSAAYIHPPETARRIPIEAH